MFEMVDFRRSLPLLMVSVIVACGPTITDVDEAETSASTAMSPSGLDTSVPPAPTTAPPTDPDTTAGPEPSTTTLAEPEPTTTGDPDGCPPNVVVGFEEEVPGGYSAADLLATLTGTQITAWAWPALPRQPTTTLHVSLVYEGAPIELGPRGDDGGLFLSAPCDEGLLFDVRLELVSDDGIVMASVPALFNGWGGPSFRAFVTTPMLDIEALGGTLASQSLIDPESGLPATVRTVAFAFQRTIDRAPQMDPFDITTGMLTAQTDRGLLWIGEGYQES